MPFSIIRDDITRVAADAIVNTADPEPVVGAGTDSAIHSAAGPRLLRARQRIGRIAVGSSVQTPAYDLPARYVLHTVSPAWIDGAHGERELLRRAYDAALNLAHRLGCLSVAFPLLSAKSLGFPQEIALSVAVGAFADFLLTHDLQIILVLFDHEPFSLAQGLFGDLKAYVDDRYVGEAEAVEYADSSNAFSMSKLLLTDEDRQKLPEQRLRGERPARVGSPARRAERRDVLCNRVEPKEPGTADYHTVLRDVESTFSEHLLDLLDECGEKDSDVYRRAEISRQLFHKIIHKKDYQPTKSTAIQLAIGLRLDLHRTQRLLEKAGYALTRSSRTDLVVQYFIERGIFSIVEINLALYDCGLPLLKTGASN